MAEALIESLQAQIRSLEERIKVLEEAVKPANLAAVVGRRQGFIGT